MRSPEAVEYSKTFLEWNQRKRQEGEASAQHAGRRPFSALGLGSGALRKRPRASPAPALPVYSCGRMEGTRFRDLSIRPGALYVYFHQVTSLPGFCRSHWVWASGAAVLIGLVHAGSGAIGRCHSRACMPR